MKKELLKVNNLKQYFPVKGGFLGRTVNHVKAVDDISFEIYEGETLSVWLRKIDYRSCNSSIRRTN